MYDLTGKVLPLSPLLSYSMKLQLKVLPVLIGFYLSSLSGLNTFSMTISIL